MKFSYNAVWQDTLGLTRAHAPLLAAIAGVFIFLPAVAFAIFLKPPEPARGADIALIFSQMYAYWISIAPWALAQALINMIGTLAMLRLVLARGSSVGEALLAGLKLVPFYLLLSVVLLALFAIACLPVTIVAMAGGMSGLANPIVRLVLLVGVFVTLAAIFYLTGRVVPAVPVLVAEDRRNPVSVLTRSFDLTRGKGWAVFGLVLIVVIVGAIAIGVADIIAGLIFALVAGLELGMLLTSVFGSLLSSGFAILILMLYVAIYRALADPGSVERVFD